MLDEKAAARRIETLIERGIPFAPTRMQGRILTHAEELAAAGWVESVVGVVRSIVPSLGEHYRTKCRDLSARFDAPYKAGRHPSVIRSECVGELISFLQDLLADLRARGIAAPLGKAIPATGVDAGSFAGND